MDGKRGNIGPTCKAYAQAYLGNTLLSGDALTINPYLGRDGIMPFIKVANNNDKGIFILTKTSNPSSDDLQNIVTDQWMKAHRLACGMKWIVFSSIIRLIRKFDILKL